MAKYVSIKFIRYYIAVPANGDSAYHGTKRYIDKVAKYAEVRTKAMKYIFLAGRFVKKGNVDVEIVLDVVREIDRLDLVIILSGDSDFYELKKYIIGERGKKIIFMGYERNMAWELRQCWHIYLNRIRKQVELK